MSCQKRCPSHGGAPPARCRAVGSHTSRHPALSGPGSLFSAVPVSPVCPAPAIVQVPATATAAAASSAAPSTYLESWLMASPGSLTAGSGCSVSPSGLAV
jgi:hypothetical protein